VYAITSLIYPKLTLSATLLSGISTALGAPFAINFIGRGSLALLVGVIIVTSIAVPFTLPAIVYILFGHQITVPIFNMMSLLAAGILIPLFVGWLVTRTAQTLASSINKNSLIFSLILVALVNLSVFGKFSSYFFMEPEFIIELLVAVFLLFCLHCAAGYYYDTLLIMIGKKSNSREKMCNNKPNTKIDRITGLIAMTYISNVFVVVIAKQFFEVPTEALAAFYQIPYYAGLLILRKFFS